MTKGLISGLLIVICLTVLLSFVTRHFFIAEGEVAMTIEECNGGNLMLLEGRLSRVLGAVPPLVGPARCYKTGYSSDMIAAAQIDPTATVPDWAFVPATDAEEVPLSFLFKLYPEAFNQDARKGLSIAIAFDPVSNASVTLVNLKDGQRFVLVSEQM